MQKLRELIMVIRRAMPGYTRLAENTIQSWDFTVMKRYMVQYGIYTKDNVDAAEREYKRYLILNAHFPDKFLPISSEVDPFWHTHILFTQDYARLCYNVFGMFMHHRPAILDSQHKLDGLFMGSTVPLYKKLFGDVPQEYWGRACCAGGCCSKVWDMAAA